MRVGILGGTFDPPHVGHLILGEYAADALDLEHLLFIPAADPPHKQDEEKTSVAHRLAMLERALSGNARFELSRVDIDRPGPHYSLDTVKIIGEQYPGADIYFVMGSDSLRDLPNWHRAADMIRLCRLAVMRRPGADVSPTMHENVLPGLAQRVTMFDAPRLEISSTEIVHRLSEGKSVRYLLIDAVREYICEHQLYGAQG